MCGYRTIQDLECRRKRLQLILDEPEEKDFKLYPRSEVTVNAPIPSKPFEHAESRQGHIHDCWLEDEIVGRIDLYN